MKELSINGHFICELPENWNELTQSQLLNLCSLFYTCDSPESLTTKLLLLFSGLKFCQNRNPVIVDEIPCWYLKHHNMNVALISAEHLVFAASPLKFLFTENNGVQTIQSQLYLNKIPVIEIRGKKYYGPDSALYNIRFAEFMRLEALYEQYVNTGDSRFIDKLIAVLYRPADPNSKPESPSFSGDIRIPFNDHIAMKNEKRISKLSESTKLAIRLFYEGSRWFIFLGCKLFKNAFSGNASTDSSQTTMQQFSKLVSALSNDDVTKSEQIRQTLAWDIFHHLENIAVRNLELKNKHHV